MKATAAPSSSTRTTEPTLRSRIISAIRRTVASAGAVTTDSVMTSRISIARRTLVEPLAIRFAAVAPPSPTQLAWRRRIEAVLRVAAPALDLLLAAGDRFSRVVARGDDELESPAAGPPAPVPPGRRVGPGATAAE